MEKNQGFPPSFGSPLLQCETADREQNLIFVQNSGMTDAEVNFKLPQTNDVTKDAPYLSPISEYLSFTTTEKVKTCT